MADVLGKNDVLILRLLLKAKTHGPPNVLFGHEMVQQSHGLLRRGSVYVALHSLEERGLVESYLEPDAPQVLPMRPMARRLYSITLGGMRVLNAWNSFQACLTDARERKGK